MKKILLTGSILLLFITVSAQDKIPSFGKIDKAELEMTDCDFDKGAIAVKLLDVGRMFYDRGTAGVTLFKTKYEYRVRIKILKDKGLSYANVEIPFYSNNDDEKISNIDACTFNLNESGKVKVTDVSKSSIYVRKINKRYSRLVIVFPDVKIGSVIEYKYKLARETYTNIKEWSFQDEIPTRYSEYEVNVPRIFYFTPHSTITGNVEVKEKESVDVVTIEKDAYSFTILKQNYIMRNLIGIREEPFMGASNDYKQRVEFRLSHIDHGDNNIESLQSTWEDVTKSLKKDEDFCLQLTKEIPGIAPLVLEAMRISDKNERTEFLFNAIRKRMNCDDPEAIFTNEGVDQAWEKRTGNVAEINMMLVNVLKRSGITAFPILLSTRQNGLLNPNYYSLNQFSIVMAYVQTGTGTFILDATDKISNYKLTPINIANTKGFVVNDEAGKWVDVIDVTHKYKQVLTLQATIDENGSLTGDCFVNCFDYARKRRVDEYSKSIDNYKQQYFIKPYPAVSVKAISITNVETDSLPLVQKVNFSTTANNSSGYIYFNTNYFNDFESNPFIEQDRISDIDFGYLQEYQINENFTIPEGYVFDALPQNISLIMNGRGIQYNRVMVTSGNKLSLKITIDFKQPFYLLKRYPDLQEFYKKLLSSLNEQVVIKKK